MTVSVQEYEMDVILRQQWIDPRLLNPNRKGKGIYTILYRYMTKVWVPDIIFINEIRSHIHTTTSQLSNIGIHVLPNGRITHSQR